MLLPPAGLVLAIKRIKKEEKNCHLWMIVSTAIFKDRLILELSFQSHLAKGLAVAGPLGGMSMAAAPVSQQCWPRAGIRGYRRFCISVPT